MTRDLFTAQWPSFLVVWFLPPSVPSLPFPTLLLATARGAWLRELLYDRLVLMTCFLETEAERHFYRAVCMQGGLSHKRNVCPYVKRVNIVTERKKLVPTFLYHMKDHSS